jgi:ketosteroid isomerase-like protein
MRFLLPSLLALLFTTNAAGAAEVPAQMPAEVPAYIGRHATTVEDQRAIQQVVTDFQAALRTKDIRLLSSLMLNTDIPFSSPASPQAVKKMRAAYDPNANGLRAGGFHDFARFVRESKVPVEERFYNVKITQDKHIAWVMFDYEFVEDGKVWNYGIETWQMMQNLDGKWKIASVWWSTNLMP